MTPDQAAAVAAPSSNGHGAPQQFLTKTYTKGYRPPMSAVGSSWGSTLTPGLTFTLEMVRDMVQDSQVSSCLAFIKAPMFLAQRDVVATDPATKNYVEKTYTRFWNFALQHANRRFEYGHSPGEAIYREKDGWLEFRGMRPIWPRDATPWTVGEMLDFVEVRNVNGDGQQAEGAPLRLMGAREDRPAKGLWFVHKPTYSQYWGRSVLFPVWFPWRLKRMPDGMWEIVFKFAYRHSLGHTIGRHPDSMVEGPNGDLWAQDLMRLMLQNLKAGSDITLPGTKDEAGNYLWSIERDSVVQGDAGGLLNILEALDKEIQRGIGIPDEVINFEGAGTNAKAKVAVLSFYVSLTEDYYQLSESFDDQVVRPAVKMMAKKGKLPSDANYEVKPKPLMPPDEQQPGEGGGGGGAPRPIAPGGVPAPLPFSTKASGGATPSTASGMPSGAMFSVDTGEEMEGWSEIATDKATHVRIVGPTKSGKSVLAQALAAQMPGKLYILDPVWVPGNWGGLPAATVTADGDYEQIRGSINGLLAEMRRRSAKLQEGQKDFERLTIIFDEVPDTVSELPKEAGLLIRRLSQRGRHANMHLIGIGQSSRVESWGIGGYGDVTENFCSIYLGSKAYEKMPELRGKERPGVLEWAGKLYEIDLAEVLGRSKKSIPKERLFKLPESGAAMSKGDELTGGEWRTIGAKDGHGGSRVYIKDGRIAIGHSSLKGKKIAALSDKDEPEKKAEEKPAKADDETPTWQPNLFDSGAKSIAKQRKMFDESPLPKEEKDREDAEGQQMLPGTELPKPAPGEPTVTHGPKQTKEEKAQAAAEKKKAGVEHQAEMRQSRTAARIAHATRALNEHGIESADLHQLAAELIEHDKAFKGEHLKILQDARKMSRKAEYTNLGAGNIHKHIAAGGDYADVKGFDEIADAMAGRYPDYFQGFAPEERLWSMLQHENPEHMTEDEAYEQAIELLWQHGGKRHKVSDAPLPFSQWDEDAHPRDDGGRFTHKQARAHVKQRRADLKARDRYTDRHIEDEGGWEEYAERLQASRADAEEYLEGQIKQAGQSRRASRAENVVANLPDEASGERLQRLLAKANAKMAADGMADTEVYYVPGFGWDFRLPGAAEGYQRQTDRDLLALYEKQTEKTPQVTSAISDLRKRLATSELDAVRLRGVAFSQDPSRGQPGNAGQFGPGGYGKGADVATLHGGQKTGAGPRVMADPAAEAVGKALLGNGFTAQAAASLVGAPDGAKVRLTRSGQGELIVQVQHPQFTAKRSIRRDEQGRVFIENKEFFMNPNAQGSGIGSTIFANQVQAAKQQGVAYIQCHAAKDNPEKPTEPHNGYYTWPRLGYDQPIGEMVAAVDRAPPEWGARVQALHQQFPQAQTLLDVMMQPGGRDWWRQNGFDLPAAKFDLADGSRSMAVMGAYLEERAQRAMAMSNESDDERRGSGREEIELSPAEEAALERAWRRLEQQAKGQGGKDGFTRRR